MKKLLLIASLFSVGCAFAMEDTTLLSMGDVFDVQKLQQENFELRKERIKINRPLGLIFKGFCQLERLGDDESFEVQHRFLKKFNIVDQQPIKTEISLVRRSGRVALSGVLVSGAICAGVGAVDVLQGKGSARLVKVATVATLYTAFATWRPLENELTKNFLAFEQKVSDAIVEKVLAHKKMVVAGAVVAGGLAAYYAK